MKVFLGDSGSLFLGCLVSIYVLYILSNEYIIKPTFDINKIIFVLSVMPYPIIDLVRIFFKRIIEKKSPYIADKNHIHHGLFKIFKSHALVVVTILSFSIVFLILTQIIF